MESINLIIWSGQPIFIEGIKNIFNRQISINIFEYDENNLNSSVNIRENVFNFILINDVCSDKNTILNFIKKLSLKSEQLKTIICTNREEADYLKKLKKLGVKGFIHLGSSFITLPSIITFINDGNIYYDPKLKGLLLNREADDNNLELPVIELTKREKEVLLLISKGMKNIEIAQELYLSPRTIEIYKSHLIEKLNLTGASELLKYAVKIKVTVNQPHDYL
jgi:DNA-binding NarL/FixJ family response regulator